MFTEVEDHSLGSPVRLQILTGAIAIQSASAAFVSPDSKEHTACGSGDLVNGILS
jgi:hypothetical protein